MSTKSVPFQMQIRKYKILEVIHPKKAISHTKYPSRTRLPHLAHDYSHLAHDYSHLIHDYPHLAHDYPHLAYDFKVDRDGIFTVNARKLTG